MQEHLDVGFFHRADVDGIFSAAIFLIARPKAKVFLTNYGNAETLRMCRLIDNVVRAKSHGRIVIADLNLSRAVLEPMMVALRLARLRGWKILWLDHHRWDPKVVSSLRKVAILHRDTKKCAAELVWSQLAYNDSIAHRLAQIAHVIDLGIKQPASGAMLTDIITCYNTMNRRDSRLIRLARQISKGILWTLNENDIWRGYVKTREGKIQGLIDSMRVYTVGKLKVAVGVADELIGSSKSCRTLIQEAKADIGITVTPTGKVSLRRKEGAKVHLNKIANAIDPLGGGHEFAAGSFVPFKVTSARNAGKARRIILAAIRKTI